MQKSASIRAAGSQLVCACNRGANARIGATSETEEESLKLLYVQVIYCHLALCYTLKKKVKIKLEELMES